MAINSITTNVAAQFARANVAASNKLSSKYVGRLSSGERIISASDDIAGLAIGTALSRKVTVLRTELQNASQGRSMLQVADGALGEITDILQRQKSLATMASSGAMTDVERGFLDQEFQALTQEVIRIAQTTKFNGQELFTGGKQTTRTRLINTPFVAYNTVTNASAFGGGAGRLRFVDADNTQLTVGAERQSTSEYIVGGLSNFKMSNVVAFQTADISVEINGRTFTGTVAHRDTFVVVSNGKDRIRLGSAQFRLDNNSRAEFSFQRLKNSFDHVEILRRTDIDGVNFQNTRLESGSANMFFRFESYSADAEVSIKNFRYIGSEGGTLARLAVDINGETFYADNVPNRWQNNTQLRFENESQFSRERFWIRLGNIDRTGLPVAENNLASNEMLRDQMIDALNIGFARAGQGLTFGLVDANGDQIVLDAEPIIDATIYRKAGGLNIGSLSEAKSASEELDKSMQFITESRVRFASMAVRLDALTANKETALQNQDAARAAFLDTDIAATSTEYAQERVRSSAAIASLAQANLLSRQFLELLR